MLLYFLIVSLPAVSVPLPAPSPILVGGFILLALAVAAGFVAAVRRSGGRTVPAAAVTAVWLTFTGGLAAARLLTFETPPTMLPVLAGSLGLGVAIALGPVGRRLAALPIALLVGAQAFRIVVEILLHRAYAEGLMPVQMSWSGRNFDIVTGAAALLLAPLLARQREEWSRTLVLAWNTLGLALLLNVVTVAILSAPTPMRRFMNEPANTWITQFPFVWLPAVMVVTALAGHLVIFRRLLADRRA